MSHTSLIYIKKLLITKSGMNFICKKVILRIYDEIEYSEDTIYEKVIIFKYVCLFLFKNFQSNSFMFDYSKDVYT